jgi:hypothetical protein
MTPERRRARQKQQLAGNSPIDTAASYEVMRDCPRHICIGPDYNRLLQQKIRFNHGKKEKGSPSQE